MFFHKEKRAVGIGIMLVLTTFAYSAANVNAEDLPVAEARGPYVVDECTAVPFDASGSYDPQGVTLEYRWDFNGTWTDWSLSPYREYTWRDDFYVVITLEVRAVDTDRTAYDTAEVTVVNTPPIINSIDGPSDPVYVGDTVLVTVHFYDGDPRMDVKSLDTYIATYYWGDDNSSEYNVGVGEFIITGSHVYAQPGDYDIFITIFDDDGGDANGDYYITVIAPEIFTIDAGPDGFIDEGSLFTSAGSFISSEGGLFTATVYYGDGTGSQPLDLSPEYTFDLSHQYVENGMYTIVVTVYNEDMEWVSDSAMVMVNNVAPTATLGNNGPKGEGSPVTISFSNQYDPGTSDTFTYSFDWNNDGTYEILDQTEASTIHTWYNNGVYTIKCMIKDDDNGFTEYTTTVTINNVPPTAALGNNGPKDEGSTVTVLFGDQYDPGTSDSFTYSYDWNNDGIYEIVDQVGASAQYTWYDNGVYTVKAKIMDNDGGFTEYTTDVMVNNVPPSIVSMTGPPTNPIRIGNAIYLLGVFTDPGVLDSHIALIQWGDTQTTTVNLPAGVYQVNRSHTYASVGVYTITLTITDDDGGSDTKSIETYIVVYDPICGFVTGGGWGIIPVGSYPANPDLGGRVNFGFVAKYKKGCYIPEGNTEFQFQVGDMNFHSHIYDWLIITGPKATYQGNGTINGQGHYGFRFTVIDGKISGGGGVDKFRMKIWDKDNNNQLIFDNNIGAPDNQDPSTPLSGGQITIHKA